MLLYILRDLRLSGRVLLILSVTSVTIWSDQLLCMRQWPSITARGLVFSNFLFVFLGNCKFVVYLFLSYFMVFLMSGKCVQFAAYASALTFQNHMCIISIFSSYTWSLLFEVNNKRTGNYHAPAPYSLLTLKKWNERNYPVYILKCLVPTQNSHRW